PCARAGRRIGHAACMHQETRPKREPTRSSPRPSADLPAELPTPERRPPSRFGGPGRRDGTGRGGARMTRANAITGRAAGGRTGPGPLAGHVRARPHSTGEGKPAEEPMAKGLGWFSIGLSLTQVLAPRGFARLIGVRDEPGNATLLRLVGLRELACGVGLLTRRRPAGWAWARVAGDMMDIALLGSALASRPSCPRRVT